MWKIEAFLLFQNSKMAKHDKIRHYFYTDTLFIISIQKNK